MQMSCDIQFWELRIWRGWSKPLKTIASGRVQLAYHTENKKNRYGNRSLSSPDVRRSFYRQPSSVASCHGSVMSAVMICCRNHAKWNSMVVVTRKHTNWCGSAKRDVTHALATVIYNNTCLHFYVGLNFQCLCTPMHLLVCATWTIIRKQPWLNKAENVEWIAQWEMKKLNNLFQNCKPFRNRLNRCREWRPEHDSHTIDTSVRFTADRK